MQVFLVRLMLISIPLSLILFAGYLASKQMDGWGWFLFAGVVLAGGLQFHSDSSEEDE